ncbi:MAG: ester cyclase, partial [Dehalococcoidia bacterium]
GAAPRRCTVLEENRALAHRLHQEIIQEYKLDLADEIIAPDCVVHSPVRDPKTTPRGPEVAKAMARDDREHFPTGIRFDHYDTLAEGDLVAFRWVGSGTHKSGKPVEINGIDIVRIANGKIAEVWVSYDRLAIQEQFSGPTAS